MITRLTVWGLGPHVTPETVRLNATGTTVVAGPSQAGKTMLVEALCFLLWGCDSKGKAFPVELINRDAEEVGVEVVLRSGTLLRRTMTRGRRITREMEKAGVPKSCGTEKEWRAELGALGDDRLRLALVPLGWVPLVEGAGGGRPWRDFVGAFLPMQDTRAIVGELLDEAGFQLKRRDPLDEETAKTRRRETRDALTSWDAKVEELQKLQQVTKATTPDAGPHAAHVQEAQAILNADLEWRHYIEAHGAYSKAKAELAAKNKAWAALGDCPPDYADGVLEAERVLRKADEQVRLSKRNVDRMEWEHQRARDAVSALEGGAGAVCPTCGQAWPGHEGALNEAQAAAKVAADRLKETWSVHNQKEELAKDAAKTLEELRALNLPAQVWKQKRAELGMMVEPQKPPAPKSEEPRPADVERAKELLREARELEGARKQRQRDLQQISDSLSGAMAEAAKYSEEVKRSEALLAAIRRAPSVAARRQAQLVGDLGPVELRFPSEGPASEVLVDGLPYWTASTGRQVVADVFLRLWLRRAFKVPWFMLTVDRVQDVAGQRLPDASPALHLLTREGALEVLDG